MADETHEVLIIGGGTAGITLAASLRKRAPGTKIAIVEPRAEHYYQPAFTLVGAGQFSLAATKRQTKSLIPSGVQLIEGAAKTFAPENNRVTLEDGRSLTYKYLVVAAGLSLDWEKVKGLSETLGKNGVSSNYSPTTAPYTWECVQKLKAGDKAVFTQAPLPFKCPGAPQKAVYLTADHLQRKGILKNVKMDYFVHGPAIFGVPYFAKELMKVIARYGVPAHFQHNLVAVDGDKKIATFEVVGGDKQGQSLEVPFDFLHVTPPQSPPAALRTSPLANPAGFIDVDQATLQHKTFKNVFSLGDIAATPNSKTAAAIRKQSPVVVKNLMALMAGREGTEKYDGYASCPLTTAKGKCIMAEFIYGGKVTPTLPLNPAKERWINWWIKKSALPFFYWNYMLKGREWFLKHNTAFKE